MKIGNPSIRPLEHPDYSPDPRGVRIRRPAAAPPARCTQSDVSAGGTGRLATSWPQPSAPSQPPPAGILPRSGHDSGCGPLGQMRLEHWMHLLLGWFPILSLLIPVVYRSNSVASFLSKVDLLNLIGLIEFPLFMRNVFKGTSDVQ